VSGPAADRCQGRRQFTVLGFLTFATGLVDAASVLGLGHVFTANMTGNVAFLGSRWPARAPYQRPPAPSRSARS
jgi:hypothetical protein